MPYTEMENTWMKLFLISEHAKREPQCQFTSFTHLLNRGFIKGCYNSLNRNKVVGIDCVCVYTYTVTCEV